MAQGNSINAARAKRAALKLIGPIYSIPIRWATKAVPQIIEVNRSSASAL
jgi:hypothetical protein